MKRQKRFYNLGKDYWWFANKYNIVSKYLDTLTLGASQRIIDFGCGPGNFMLQLAKYGKIYGADISLDALRFCKGRREHRVLQLEEGARIPIRDNTFDFIIALDVLEHIEDDREMMREFYRIAKVGGRVILTVPSYLFLWGKHDELYGHKRRYTRARLVKVIEEANFHIEKLSYIYILFFLPLYLLRKLKNLLRIERDDFNRVPGILNKFLIWLNGLELHCLTRCNLPFGTSLFCIATKRQEII
jgi:SAM-dependent methyltransferase